MTKKILYLLLAVSLGLNAGVLAMTLLQRPADPQPGPLGPGGGPGGRPGPGPAAAPDRIVTQHVEGMTRHLGLDAGQQRAVREIMERHVPELIRLRAATRETAQRISEAYAAPDFDPEAFARLTAEAGAARARLDSLSAVMLVAEAAVLTPEQRVRFAEVAPTVHSAPQRPPRGDRPPRPRDGGPERPRR